MTVTEMKGNENTVIALPDGWKWVKLEDLLHLNDSGIWGTQDLLDGLLVIRSVNFRNNGSISTENLAKIIPNTVNIQNKRLIGGDILLERSGGGPKQPVGRVALFTLDGKYYFGNFISRLRCKSNVDSNFLFLYLHSIHLNGVTIQLQDQTTGIRNLRFSEYLQLPISLPPTLAEQERIARILNEQMVAVGKARAAAEARLEAAKSLPAAYLRQVFPKPGQELPESWQWARLKDVCDVVNGFGFPEHLQGRTDLPYPFIKVSDMNAPGAERVVTSAANTVNQEVLKLIGGRVYPCGTVIFPKVGGALLTNKKRILGTTACLDNNVMGVVPKKVASDYVFYWFQTIDLRTLANVQALPSVKQSSVASLEFPLAPPAEQERIVAVLNERIGVAVKIVQTLHQELETINALPAVLLRRAFSGGL